jgi:hypothetical protein
VIEGETSKEQAMAATQPKRREEPPVSKVLEDRVRPDAEMVGQILDPARTPETVQYPDPEPPQGGVDSIADVEMSRRTDAGPREAAAGKFSSGGVMLWVGIVAAVAFVMFAIASL